MGAALRVGLGWKKPEKTSKNLLNSSALTLRNLSKDWGQIKP